MFQLSSPKLVADQIDALLKFSQQQVCEAQNSATLIQDPAAFKAIACLAGAVNILNTLMILALADYQTTEESNDPPAHCP